MDEDIHISLRRERLHEQIAERLQLLMVEKSLLPGERLPSERKLAEQFGVSRTVIREVLRVLSERGLVNVKPGSGVYVKEMNSDGVSDSIKLLLKFRKDSQSFEKLNEVRRTIEIEVAGFAAERATEEDIATLEGTIELMAEHAENAEQFVRFDLSFHSALTRASKNELYGALLEPLEELLLDFRLTIYQYDKEGSIKGGLAYHRQILNHIKARDPVGARQAMDEHLEQGIKLFADAREWAEKC